MMCLNEKLEHNFLPGDDYDGEYETAAHQAAAEGDSQLLVTAIKQDPGSIQQKDNEGNRVSVANLTFVYHNH